MLPWGASEVRFTLSFGRSGVFSVIRTWLLFKVVGIFCLLFLRIKIILRFLHCLGKEEKWRKTANSVAPG